VFGFLALILYGVMFRIVDALIDLTKRLAGHVPPDIEAMVEMVNVLLFITIAMIVIGIIWDIYVYWKRNSFAENILKLLP
jgi:cbb3-type cytochrome oxidase subunit 3